MELTQTSKIHELPQIKGAYYKTNATTYTVSDEFINNLIKNLYVVNDLSDGDIDNDDSFTFLNHEEWCFKLQENFYLDVFADMKITGFTTVLRGDGYLTPDDYTDHIASAECQNVTVFIDEGTEVQLTIEQKKKIENDLEKQWLSK